MRLQLSTNVLAICLLLAGLAYLVQAVAITPRIRFGKRAAWFWSLSNASAGLLHLLVAYHAARGTAGELQSAWVTPLAASETLFTWWGLAALRSWRIEVHPKPVGDRRRLRFFSD